MSTFMKPLKQVIKILCLPTIFTVQVYYGPPRTQAGDYISVGTRNTFL
jgi:hypothetical protein